MTSVPGPGHDDVLQHLEPGRREFVKGLIAATSFVTPLVASFSLDGLTIESAEAIHLSNQSQCVLQTEYVGPRSYLAALYSLGNDAGNHGVADLTVKRRYESLSLEFRLKFSSGVLVDEAQIVLPLASPLAPTVAWSRYPGPYRVLADLVGLKGRVDDVAAGSPCSFAGMLQEMAAGHTWVRVVMPSGKILAGQITPQADAERDNND